MVGAIDPKTIQNSFLGDIFKDFRIYTEGKIPGRAQPSDWKPWDIDFMKLISHTC